MAVVTVSRQFGAGGLRVAAAVAEALGYRLVDRELVEEAARRMGLDPEVARSFDERVPALLEEIGLALAAGTPQFAPGPSPQPDDRSMAQATRAVILTLADAGGYVILGRGGQAALADRREACHLSLVGDLQDRARRVAAWQGLDERAARDRCERMDRERAAYVKRFYGLDIRDHLLYDAVLNTTRLGLDLATGIAVELVRRKLELA
jgi:cytidylate kinase